MGDSAKAGLRQLMPSVFNGIATAIAAAAGLIGLLHQTGYLGNHPRVRAGIEARARAHPRMLDQPARWLRSSPAASDLPASAVDNHAVAPPAPMHHRNLNGAWRDMGSNCHLIKQTGRELTVSSYYGGQRPAVGGRERNRQRTDRLGANKLHESRLAGSRPHPLRRRPRIVGDDQRDQGHPPRKVALRRPLMPPDCVRSRLTSRSPTSRDAAPEFLQQHAHQLGMLLRKK